MIKYQIVSETHPTVSTGNDMEATGTELTSMLAEIQRFAPQGDVGFTFPEEEDEEDEEEAPEKEGDGEGEAKEG